MGGKCPSFLERRRLASSSILGHDLTKGKGQGLGMAQRLSPEKMRNRKVVEDLGIIILFPGFRTERIQNHQPVEFASNHGIYIIPL
jgi:hypothetical protein